MIDFRAIMVALFVTLCGCARQTPSTPEANEQNAYPYGFYEFVLKDGTRCVSIENHGSGITCDWNWRSHQ